jgi:hypothetical protein
MIIKNNLQKNLQIKSAAQMMDRSVLILVQDGRIPHFFYICLKWQKEINVFPQCLFTCNCNNAVIKWLICTEYDKCD